MSINDQKDREEAERIYHENNDTDWGKIGLVIGFLTVVCVMGGLVLMLHNFQVEMEENRAQRLIEYEQAKITWASLTCDEQRDYLTDGKSLQSSHILYYNQNEEFYRLWVLECN